VDVVDNELSGEHNVDYRALLPTATSDHDPWAQHVSNSIGVAPRAPIREAS
jgi:hypothetical protein